MALTVKDVDYIAKLSRLSFSEEEKEKFLVDFAQILDYVGMIEEVDTSRVEATTNVFPMENVLREDEVAPSYDNALLMRSAISQEDGAYLVPKVVE